MTTTATVKWFKKALHNLGLAQFNLATDTIKLGFTAGTLVPTAESVDPHWGGTGTTNFATDQVGTGGTAYTGPVALQNTEWALTPGGIVLQADDMSWPRDVNGFSNAKFAIVFDATDARKRALGFIDLTNVSIAAAPLQLNWGSSDNNVLGLSV